MKSLFRNLLLLLKRGGLPFLLLCYSLFANLTQGNVVRMLFFCIMVLVLTPMKKYVDKNATLISIFALSYSLLLYVVNESSVSTLLIYLVPPVFFYVYGKCLVDKLEDNSLLILALWCVAFFFIVTLFSRVFTDISVNGFINVSRLIGQNENDYLSATLYGLNVSLGFVGLPMLFVLDKKKMLCRFMFVLLSFMSFTVVLHLVNRTGLIVALVALLIVLLWRYNEKKRLLVATILFLVIVFCSLLKLGVINDSIIVAYTDRSENLATGGDRFWRWSDAMMKMWSYPLGWVNASDTFTAYAHNMWLDVARYVGLLPCLLLVLITINQIKDMRKLYGRKDEVIGLLLAFNVCILTSCLVEPVLEAMPIYFYLYLMIWGMQNQYYRKIRGLNKFE